MNMLRLFAIGTVACVLTAGVQAEEKKVDTKLLMGKWEAVKVDKKDKAAPDCLPVGAIVEFAADKLTCTCKQDGKEMKIEAPYKLDGNKFSFSAKGPDGKDAKMTITINKLTDDTMVATNDQGVKVEFKRKK